MKQLSIRRILLSTAIVVVSFLTSCEDDDVVRVFEVAFETTEAGVATKDAETTVTVKFSSPTVQEVTLTIDLTETDVIYGTDYSTTPAATDNVLTLSVPVGAESVSFFAKRLVEFINNGNYVNFDLSAVSGDDVAEIVGNSSFKLSFEEVTSTGGVIDLETGGPNQPNQVYLDLSTFSQTAVRRDTWELAFYSGAENRVFLNAALLVSAAELTESNDIDAVTSSTAFETPLQLSSFGAPVTVNNVSELMAGSPVSYSQYGDYCDSQDGKLEGTAFAEISATDAENKVYLVSLGNEIPDTQPEAGGIATTGDHRGFYKVRILIDGDDYVVQYAGIDETTHNEVKIAKNTSYNHVFFSLSSEKEVTVEPTKSKWDINMSGVFAFHSGGFGLTYSDYGLHNTLGGTGVYVLTNDHGTGEDAVEGTTDITYDDFTKANIVEDEFITDNRALITSSWRSTDSGTAHDYMYFVVKDVDGNYFKLKFTRLLSEEGERGYAQLKYELLQ